LKLHNEVKERELERLELKQEAARATEAAAESDRLRGEAERAARAGGEEFARRVAVADAEVARLRDMNEEAQRTLVALAQVLAAGSMAIRQVEERAGLDEMNRHTHELERERDNEREL
jgi:hypothetical protein